MKKERILKKIKALHFMVMSLFAILLLTGCSLNSDAEPTVDAEALMTQVVDTVVAGMTQTAAAQPTTTPTQTTTPTKTQTNTPATLPTLNIPAGIPTSSNPANTSGIDTGCNQAGFMADVTIPDNTVVDPGVTFTKTWQFKNIGTCNWTTDYKLVFYSGSQMGGPTSQPLTTAVIAPDSLLDVSVELTAPSEAGEYLGYWAFQTGANETFGIGSVGQPFYVQIKVGSPPAETATVTATATETVTPTK